MIDLENGVLRQAVAAFSLGPGRGREDGTWNKKGGRTGQGGRR